MEQYGHILRSEWLSLINPVSFLGWELLVELVRAFDFFLEEVFLFGQVPKVVMLVVVFCVLCVCVLQMTLDLSNSSDETNGVSWCLGLWSISAEDCNQRSSV